MRERHRFLMAYDIRDPKRLRKVHRFAKEFGWPMQYSVFVADLDGTELAELQLRLGEIIKHDEDSIAFVDVGLPNDRGKSSFRFMGRAPILPTAGPLII